jgi:glycosyltransferase involved in cell wall biosynthesis
MGLAALYIAKVLQLPLVGVYHSAIPEFLDAHLKVLRRRFYLPDDCFRAGIKGLSWRYLAWYYRHCTVSLVPSRSIQEKLKEKLGGCVGIFTRGVDSRQFSPDYWKPRDKLTLLYVGQILEERIPLLLRRILSGKSGLEVVIVGDGPYRKEMEAALPNASFSGHLTGKTLSEAYASADLFLYPSETDTPGNFVLEAMSSGLPALVSAKMGLEGLVTHGKNGFVCENIAKFRQYIDLLVSNTELRLQMGREARAYALEQSWDKVCRQLFEIYGRVLNQTDPLLETPARSGEFQESWDLTW